MKKEGKKYSVIFKKKRKGREGMMMRMYGLP
jgi:hypothetical protein